MSKDSDRTLINKAVEVVLSCTTQEQLTVAHNYCSIVYRKLEEGSTQDDQYNNRR